MQRTFIRGEGDEEGRKLSEDLSFKGVMGPFVAKSIARFGRLEKNLRRIFCRLPFPMDRFLDQDARQTLPCMAGKDSADGKAVHALAFSAGFSGIMPDMKRMKAFKFRLVPTPEQESLLSRYAGCVRFVWNKALDLQARRPDAGIPLLSCGDLAKLLTLWRASEEYGFRTLGPVHPQRQTLKNLKVSTVIGETQAVVVVEDLKIRNMTKSARGTKESPGRKVRQKSGLNRSILSRGWGTFLSLLDYKLSRRGERLVRVDPKNTSRTCFSCGHIAAENRPDQTTFRCVSCGHADHADANAAKNILRAGRARSVCLEEHSSKFVA